MRLADWAERGSGWIFMVRIIRFSNTGDNPRHPRNPRLIRLIAIRRQFKLHVRCVKK